MFQYLAVICYQPSLLLSVQCLVKTVNRTNLPGDSLGTPQLYFAQQNGNIPVIALLFSMQNNSHSLPCSFHVGMLDIFMFIVYSPSSVQLSYFSSAKVNTTKTKVLGAKKEKSSQLERRITYSGLDNLAWRCSVTCWL